MATAKKKAIPPDTCNLTLTIRGESYALRPFPAPAFGSGAVGWRLTKAGGATHHVAQTEHGAVCDCGDFVYRRNYLDPNGCKHCKSLRALGLLPDVGKGMEG